jgi:hypothetical protein
MPQTQWVVVWETGDGPTVDGIFPNEEEAYNHAFEEWCAFEGGNIGGYEYDTPPEGRRAEFAKVYATTADLWVVPLSRTR